MRARLAVEWRMASARSLSRLISAPCRAASLARRSSSLARALEVLAVGALVLDELALIEVEDARDRLVEELEVVADDEEGAPVAAEEPHEPRLGVGVEVVGRLVEEEDVAAGEQDAGELDPPSLAAGEDVDGKVHAVGGEAEAGADPSDLGLGRVAAVGLVVLLGLGVAGDVAVRGILLEAEAQLLDALRLFVEPPSAEDVAEGGGVDAAAPGAGLLEEVPEGALAQNGAAVGRALAGDDLQHARLAGAVAADEPDRVTGADGEGRLVEGEAATDLDAEVAGLEHAPLWVVEGGPLKPVSVAVGGLGASTPVVVAVCAPCPRLLGTAATL